MPDVRGLMHIKNELEQRVFKGTRANMLIALWSTQGKELPAFLEAIDELGHSKAVNAVIAVNVDRVFLYNESVQKLLIDKVNTNFLRDTQFSNMNNLFSTRFVRNYHQVEETAPFLVLTDNKGHIAFAEPLKPKHFSKIGEYVANVAAGKPAKTISKPFVPDREDFELEFDKVLDEVASVAQGNEEALKLLQKFDWKGVIATHVKEIAADIKTKPKHKVRFLINLKAKAKYLNAFLELVELDKLINEKWKREGFYFKVNKHFIPTFTLQTEGLSNCQSCKKALAEDDSHFYTLGSSLDPTVVPASAVYCLDCSLSHKSEPLVYQRPSLMRDCAMSLIQVIPKTPSFKGPTIAIQCDSCSKMFKEGDVFKCLERKGFDLCDQCFTQQELSPHQEKEDEDEECTYRKRRHPFMVIRGFQNFEIKL